MIKKLLFTFFIGFISLSCKEEPQKPKEKIVTFADKILPEDIKTITPQEAKTFHKNPERKYEYRTGTYNEYEYNYDVIGIDSLENPVKGNVIVKGKYGAGMLTDSDGETFDIEVEWTGYDMLAAKDKKGNVYTLKTE